MEYHTVALIGMLYMYVGQLSTADASTTSPFRKPVLGSSPSRATDGGLYTLICNYNGRTADGDFFVMQVSWYRDNILVSSSSPVGVIPSDLEGRVNVEQNTFQNNISIIINASIDNGSVWWCTDDFTRQSSNNLTISFNDVDTTPTATLPSSSSTVASSTVSPTTPSTTVTVTSVTMSATTSANDVSKAAIRSDDDQSFIAVIAGIVVTAAVIIILITIVMRTTSRRRATFREGDDILSESFDHHANARSKYKGTDVNTVVEYVNSPWDNSSVMQENVLYFRYSDVLSPRPSQHGSPTNTGLYAQIYKATSASEQRVSSSDAFADALYTGPYKIPRVQHVS